MAALRRKLSAGGCLDDRKKNKAVGAAREPLTRGCGISQEATMARPVFWSVLGSWLLIGFGAGSVRADAWTDALFTENRHDFGMVPRV